MPTKPVDFIEKYAEAVKLTETARKRIRTLLKLSEGMNPEPYLDVLVSEDNPPGATRTLGSLILFSESYVYEFKQFLASFDWDILGLADVRYAQISASNFDLATSEENSYAQFRIGFANEGSLEWRGVGKNCESGLRVFRDRLVARLHSQAQLRDAHPPKGTQSTPKTRKSK